MDFGFEDDGLLSKEEMMRLAEAEIEQEILAQALAEEEALKLLEPELQPASRENIDAVDALLGTGANEEAVKVKPKRKIHKLTDEMLMGNDGFTKLIRQGKKFKKRSTPDKSLEDFMVMIQIWGHELFPNSKFKDFITDAEKLCSSRRMRIYREEIHREVRRTKLGIYAEESASKVPETSTQRNDEPIKIAEETKDLALMELVEEDFENEIDSKKEQAEKNRLAALAKLAARKKEREEAQRLEEEARVAAMIAESGHLFFE